MCSLQNYQIKSHGRVCYADEKTISLAQLLKLRRRRFYVESPLIRTLPVSHNIISGEVLYGHCSGLNNAKLTIISTKSSTMFLNLFGICLAELLSRNSHQRTHTHTRSYTLSSMCTSIGLLGLRIVDN